MIINGAFSARYVSQPYPIQCASNDFPLTHLSAMRPVACVWIIASVSIFKRFRSKEKPSPQIESSHKSIKIVKTILPFECSIPLRRLLIFARTPCLIRSLFSWLIFVFQSADAYAATFAYQPSRRFGEDSWMAKCAFIYYWFQIRTWWEPTDFFLTAS